MGSSTCPKEPWDERYSREAPPPPPDRWLASLAPAFSLGLPGAVLDIACGVGQNSLWLATLGLSVVGVDASAVAVDRARKRARPHRLDLNFEILELRAGSPLSATRSELWGGIVVLHFLDRGLFGEIERSLAPGGILAYKTHMTHPLRSPGSGPRSPDHLLCPGELLLAFPTLTPIAYTEWAEPWQAFAALLARRPGRHSS